MIKRYIIKHCPFCGGKGKLFNVVNSAGTMPRFRVSCLDYECPAFVANQAELGRHNTAEEAIDKWNTRNSWRKRLARWCVRSIDRIMFSE